jgi:hypothetical protein
VVLGRLGRAKEAHWAFRAAIALLKRHRPLDAARAVDYLEMSLQCGRPQEVLARVRASSPCFEQLGYTSQAFELWMDLCALLLAGGSTERTWAKIAEVRRALEESDQAPCGQVAAAPHEVSSTASERT